MNKNDSDDDDDEINNNYKRKMILDMSEQCEYKMQIINKKKKQEGTHTLHTNKNHSNMNNKKYSKIK